MSRASRSRSRGFQQFARSVVIVLLSGLDLEKFGETGKASAQIGGIQQDRFLEHERRRPRLNAQPVAIRSKNASDFGISSATALHAGPFFDGLEKALL